jgi:hypothetical protein
MERIERADEDSRRGLVLALLTGLKQICNHPAHYLKPGGRLGGRSEKLDLLDELLGTILAEDGAVLVFTQYVAMGGCSRHLAGRRPHQFLHGGTPVREREAMVRASRPARCRSSCSRSRPAAPGSTSPAPTTSSTSTAGGTPPSRTRPPTGPTGSARPGRCRCTG